MLNYCFLVETTLSSYGDNPAPYEHSYHMNAFGKAFVLNTIRSFLGVEKEGLLSRGGGDKPVKPRKKRIVILIAGSISELSNLFRYTPL